MQKYKNLSDSEIEHMITTIRDQVSFYNDIVNDETCLLVPDNIESMNPLELCAVYYRVNESVMLMLEGLPFKSFQPLEMMQEMQSVLDSFPHSLLS